MPQSKRFASFKLLMLFAKVSIIEGGFGIGRHVESTWGSLDLSASNAATNRGRATADDRRGPRDMARRVGIVAEAAKLPGVGRRAVMGYLKKYELPGVVAIACRAPARDRNLLAAHYRPARNIKPRAA